VIKGSGRGEAAKLAVDEDDECDRRESPRNDLHADGQAAAIVLNRHRRRRQTVQGRKPGPHALIEVGYLCAVAVELAGELRRDNGYLRAKIAQKKLIETSGIPYTIIRATQLLEFLGDIADSSADRNVWSGFRPGCFLPIAADDVALAVAEVALAAPRNGIFDIAGPERAPFNEIVARYLKAVGDPREVVRDPEARYFGGRVGERSLAPLGEARHRHIGLDVWLRRPRARARSPRGTLGSCELCRLSRQRA